VTGALPGPPPSGPPLWLSLLPRRLVSRFTGRLAALPIPRGLRRALYGLYARRYGANLQEMEGALDSFPSFGAFFGRPLKAGARPLPAEPDALVSPADGRIVSCGTIAEDRLPQLKGVDYTLAELFAGDAAWRTYQGGEQLTVYLAPGDYHRVHAPWSGQPRWSLHVPGDLFPVNGAAVRRIPRLFVRNERVLVGLVDRSGAPFVVAFVGALNVGSILLAFDPNLRTNRGGALVRRSYEGVAVSRGDELGRFALGSTVVVLCPPGCRIPSREAGTAVRVGETVGRWPATPAPRP
jgi:phosphatidylserine decarboxylase